MTPFCIDGCVLGTDKHLSCSDEGYSWSETVPPNVLHLSGEIKNNNDCCFDTLLKLGHTNIDLKPPERFVKSISKFLPEAYDPPWQRLMPVNEHRTFIKNLVNEATIVTNKLPLGYFQATWGPGNGVLRSLQRAKVDTQEVERLIENKVGNYHVVKTFRHDIDGLCHPTVYDRFGAITGRLTVTAGPNILTLKRDHRKTLKSKFEGGSIVSLDFAALEARVLLYEAGRCCDSSDLYAMIAKDMGGVSRKAVKGAVISELYGSSKQLLGETLGISGKELNDFVSRIKMYFNTGELLKRIKQQFVATGYIVNRYGRQVLIDEPLDHIMLNYYAQSTGVDVSLVGFSKVVDVLKKQAPRTRPLFVLHDAMLLDVPPEEMYMVESVKKIKVKGYVQTYHLKMDVISS